jgi:type I site-specific restriction endonuclease
MDKRTLSERDICTKFITPAVRQAGWDEMLQIREEVSFTKGRIMLLHGIEDPSFVRHDNTLARPLISWGKDENAWISC